MFCFDLTKTGASTEPQQTKAAILCPHCLDSRFESCGLPDKLKL